MSDTEFDNASDAQEFIRDSIHPQIKKGHGEEITLTVKNDVDEDDLLAALARIGIDNRATSTKGTAEGTHIQIRGSKNLRALALNGFTFANSSAYTAAQQGRQ